jgi:hypothetical protein
MRAFTGVLRAMHIMPTSDPPRDSEISRRRTPTLVRHRRSESGSKSPRPVSATQSFERVSRENDPASHHQTMSGAEADSTTNLAGHREDVGRRRGELEPAESFG